MEKNRVKKTVVLMFGEDQSSRKNKPNPKTINLLDKKHNFEIKGIIKEHGYPTKNLLGAKVLRCFWTLVQHQDLDLDLQKNCLKYCNFEPIEKAYLTDRILVKQGKKQIYGTQLEKDKVGQLIPRPVKNKNTLNRRRKSIGLKPIEHYVRQMNKIQANRQNL